MVKRIYVRSAPSQDGGSAVMSTNTRWDGKPPQPGQSGWHWLRHGEEPCPAYWNASTQMWEQGGLVCGGSAGPKFIASDHFQGGVHYLSPCLPPLNAPAEESGP